MYKTHDILHYLKVCFHPCNIENDLINFAEDCVLEPINELKGIDGKGEGGEEEEKQQSQPHPASSALMGCMLLHEVVRKGCS